MEQGEQKEVNLGLFEIAFKERRKINLEKLKEHTHVRSAVYQERSHILDQLQNALGQKTECTKCFLKELIRYFEEQLTLYNAFFKAMTKSGLANTPSQVFVYPALQKTILQLAEINETEIKDLKILTTWIEKVLLPALKNLLEDYKEEAKKKKSLLNNARSHVESARNKENKNMEKIQESNDLLEAQLSILQKFEGTDNALKQWGNDVLKSWGGILQKEQGLRQEMQRNINQFHSKYIKVYVQSDATKNMVKFWRQIEKSPSIYKILGSLLNEQDLAIINKGCKSNSLISNLDPWINFKQISINSPDPIKIMEILQVKLFKGKLQKSKRDYESVVIYFTVDKNMLIFSPEERKLIHKLTQNGLRIKRISENLIEVNGIQIGFLIDSKRKQVIHFGTMDQAQEFSFFIQKLQKEPHQ